MAIDKDKKILILVESPTKATHVQEIVRKLGYTKATVAATFGHTTKIRDVKDSYFNTGIYPDQNFKITWEVDPEKYKLVEDLKWKASNADIVLIAADPDREGESLGNHIKNLIGVSDDKYYRIKYHSITVADIKKALENPEKMDMSLCDAAESRQALDKLIGYRMSPIAKNYVGAKSVGRCQSVGLKIIADREHEIQNFKPETYYDIYLNFVKNGTKFKAKYAGNEILGNIEHLSKKEDAEKIIKNCTKDFKIIDIKRRVKEESPKPPFDTLAFQQEAASRLNLKVKDAMQIAQKLFEAGDITYMRTASTEMSPEFANEILKAYILEIYGENIYTPPRVEKNKK